MSRDVLSITIVIRRIASSSAVSDAADLEPHLMREGLNATTTDP